jgi:hypothetical protein
VVKFSDLKVNQKFFCGGEKFEKVSPKLANYLAEKLKYINPHPVYFTGEEKVEPTIK